MLTKTASFVFRLFGVLMLLILLFSASGVLPAQAGQFASPLFISGDFAWAKSMGGTHYDEGYAIAVDSSGNVYTTGRFSGTADFDPGAGIFNLTSVTYSDDIFVSKLDSNGDFVWAKSMGGASYDYGLGIALDSSGNVYTTGHFSDIADFDPGVGAFNLTSAGLEDIFVSRLDSNGDFVWAKSMGGASYDSAFGVAIDSNSNIYTTGYFRGIVDFDPGPGIFNLTSGGYSDIFVSKLDSSGDFVWAKGMGGGINSESYGESRSIAVDSVGNVYTTGHFQGTIDFDPGPGTFSLANVGLVDIFVSKLDSSGDFVWARRMGGADTISHGDSIAPDSSGSVYTTGYFAGTADFDPGPGIFNLTSVGYRDIFVSKLDSSGDFVWAKGMGGADTSAHGKSIALDSSGSVYTIGYFAGTADFDPGPGIFYLTSVGTEDILISRLDSSGGFAWAKRMGGTSSDYGQGIALDLSGNVYTTGYFYGTADFDPGMDISYLTSAGIGDIFVSKLETDVAPVFADVPFAYWANTFIERLYNAGITGGCSLSPLMYCPETNVNRAQMAVFLLRGEHGSTYAPPAVGTGTGFTDVPADYWAAAWIKQLAIEGITSGCGPNLYCPETSVTRDQMAVFLLRAEHGASYTPPSATGVFTDVPTDHWAAPWIEQLATEGITGGCGADTYCPSTPVTRAQMAVFLVRTFNLP